MAIAAAAKPRLIKKLIATKSTKIHKDFFCAILCFSWPTIEFFKSTLDRFSAADEVEEFGAIAAGVVAD